MYNDNKIKNVLQNKIENSERYSKANLYLFMLENPQNLG